MCCMYLFMCFTCSMCFMRVTYFICFMCYMHGTYFMCFYVGHVFMYFTCFMYFTKFTCFMCEAFEEIDSKYQPICLALLFRAHLSCYLLANPTNLLNDIEQHKHPSMPQPLCSRLAGIGYCSQFWRTDIFWDQLTRKKPFAQYYINMSISRCWKNHQSVVTMPFKNI